jgi:hypothetical protein
MSVFQKLCHNTEMLYIYYSNYSTHSALYGSYYILYLCNFFKCIDSNCNIVLYKYHLLGLHFFPNQDFVYISCCFSCSSYVPGQSYLLSNQVLVALHKLRTSWLCNVFIPLHLRSPLCWYTFISTVLEYLHLTFNIWAFQYGNLIYTGKNMKVPSWSQNELSLIVCNSRAYISCHGRLWNK